MNNIEGPEKKIPGPKLIRSGDVPFLSSDPKACPCPRRRCGTIANRPFCPISASGSNFNPRNTPCIPAVKILAFLELG